MEVEFKIVVQVFKYSLLLYTKDILITIDAFIKCPCYVYL